MKLKITSFRLLSIVLVQIVAINAFLIAIVVKEIKANSEDNNKPISIKAPEKKSSEKKSSEKAVKNSPKPKEKSSAVVQAVAVSKMPKLEVQKLNVLEDLTKRVFYFNLQNALLRAVNGSIEFDDFIATSYDLSYESCGKYPSHPAYGITFSGKKAVKGRTIAVDPDVIPLGSKVYIKFPEKYSHLDKWYIAEDTGSKVKGKILDVFFGESAFYEMEKFGSQKVKVRVVYPE
ncbi:MAG: 3D domain-containing protein [Clostridia bacterium]|nr:3D domain-containing protein [Clostridia bacterium]